MDTWLNSPPFSWDTLRLKEKYFSTILLHMEMTTLSEYTIYKQNLNTLRTRHDDCQLMWFFHRYWNHKGQATHLCVIKLSLYWFRLWVVACTPSSLYLNQCWIIVNRTLWTRIGEIWIKCNSFNAKKVNLNMQSATWSLDELKVVLWYFYQRILIYTWIWEYR